MVSSSIALTIVDTFGPNTSYNMSGALIIGDNSLRIDGSDLEQAVPFTVPGIAPIALGSLEVAVQYLDGSPNRIDFHIRSEELGLPGTIIETVSFSEVTQLAGGQVLLRTFDSHSVLNPGSNYWLSATAPGGTSEGTMLWQLQPLSSMPRKITSRIAGGAWSAPIFGFGTGAFRLIGNPIPEPSTAMLLACIVVGRVIALRARRSRLRHTG